MAMGCDCDCDCVSVAVDIITEHYGIEEKKERESKIIISIIRDIGDGSSDSSQSSRRCGE